MSATQGAQNYPKRGAIATPRNVLAAAVPYMPGGLEAATVPPPKAPNDFIRIPKSISMWGNWFYGDCVTAEEAFAKACHAPEIFITDDTVIAWATAHKVLTDSPTLHQVLVWMQGDGFAQDGHTYNDGTIHSVDWVDTAVLKQAIWEGPVKIGIASDQLYATWKAAGGNENGGTGFFATGYHPDQNSADEDHCVSLCGYGTMAWLAERLHLPVPEGVNGKNPGYAVFTWGSIGIIDTPSMLAITQEAWLRKPTTVSL